MSNFVDICTKTKIPVRLSRKVLLPIVGGLSTAYIAILNMIYTETTVMATAMSLEYLTYPQPSFIHHVIVLMIRVAVIAFSLRSIKKYI